MEPSTGFSDVDGSHRADELVGYLALLADRPDDVRRQGYAMLRVAPGASVLDVGCGAGEVCVLLAAPVGRAGTVAGIDSSEAMIAAARRAATASNRAVDLRVARIYALPFPDGTFDAVRSERVFQPLAAAVDVADITRGEADGFLAALEARDRTGIFDANAIAHFVTGTRT